jgi:hypothetical protein
MEPSCPSLTIPLVEPPQERAVPRAHAQIRYIHLRYYSFNNHTFYQAEEA